MNYAPFTCVCFCVALAAQAASADQPPAISGGPYHLFNPVPRDQMREMSTDRPDTTESPITVDAGHVQIEMSFADYRRDTHTEDQTELRAWTFAAMNVKLGLLENVDLQFVFDAWTDEETRDHSAGTRETADGFSDLMLRLKVNLWGNDGDSPTAFGLMPFIVVPTGSDELSSDHVEGGLIAPLSIELAEGLSLGLMAEVDFVRDNADDSYDVEFVHTAALGFDIVGDLGGYLEYVGITSGDAEGRYQALASTGLTYRLTPDIQLDGGVRVGLTRAAEDLNVFSGISVRF